MPPLDLDKLRQELHSKHSPEGVRKKSELAEKYITDKDLMSAAMYPKVCRHLMINSYNVSPIQLFSFGFVYVVVSTASFLLSFYIYSMK